MSHCCGGGTNHTEEKKENENLSEPPKSLIGKFLYKTGKREFEKERQSGVNKRGCC